MKSYSEAEINLQLLIQEEIKRDMIKTVSAHNPTKDVLEATQKIAEDFIAYRATRVETEPLLKMSDIPHITRDILKSVVKETEDLLSKAKWYQYLTPEFALNWKRLKAHKQLKTIVEEL